MRSEFAHEMFQVCATIPRSILLRRQFRPIAVTLSTLALAWFALLNGSSRSEELVPAERHPWGRFKTGSWKNVRVSSETLDAQGKVTGVSKTQTKSTLVELDASGYTLEIEVNVEVSGKKFAAQPQYVRQGFD